MNMYFSSTSFFCFLGPLVLFFIVHKRVHIHLIYPFSKMEFRRHWTMHFSTFVTVPVTSLLIFAAISPLTGHEFWGLCPFHGATYLCILWCYGRRILNGSACSISLFFSLIGPIVGHLLLGLGAGSSPACCCYFMYLKALNSCFFWMVTHWSTLVSFFPVSKHVAVVRVRCFVSSGLDPSGFVEGEMCSQHTHFPLFPLYPLPTHTHLWGPWC